MKNRSKILVAILPVLACFAFLPGAQAACLDGCNNSLFNVWQGDDALLNNATGTGNSAFGWRALFSNIDASFNTAVGGGALVLNNGLSNTAMGAAAGLLNTAGTENTAVGTDALVFNDSGIQNTAIGAFALFNNIADRNTAIGSDALTANTTGTFNAATGRNALLQNTEGSNNTADGHQTLFSNTIGDNNTAVGKDALFSTTGSGNIGIGVSAGSLQTVGGDNVIFIGEDGDSNAPDASDRTYIGNIRDVTVGNGDGIAVIIDSDGQLGTSNSSRRFKKDIKPMDQTSEAILGLKPVTFHYKNQDTKKAANTPQFGLIAEDVAEVSPDLVVSDKGGKPVTVRYDAVNAMLLNEFLKEHKKVEEQQASITDLKSTVALQRKEMQVLTAQLKEQAAQIQKVSAQLEMSKPAAKVVVNEP